MDIEFQMFEKVQLLLYIVTLIGGKKSPKLTTVTTVMSLGILWWQLHIQKEIFQKKVWKELQKIQYGKTKSYSEIAVAIGNRNAQRAIGSACNKNPIMIIIPCHRVISKNGKLGGFVYGNSVKQKLLEIENSA